MLPAHSHSIQEVRLSTALTRPRANWVTFPRALRDAIPEFEPCLGRVLQLENANVAATDSEWIGRRVSIKLTVCETGKLEGSFDVQVSLNIEAAKALADLLHAAAAKASKL
jgi:hypothetical protein